MEPHKRAKYSESFDPDEIEEVLTDEDSDEELEERDEVMEPRVQSSSSSEDDTEEVEDVTPQFCDNIVMVCAYRTIMFAETMGFR
jgi:flagellar basal body-associated protein FliL